MEVSPLFWDVSPSFLFRLGSPQELQFIMSRGREKTNIYVSVELLTLTPPPSVLLFMSLTNMC